MPNKLPKQYQFLTQEHAPRMLVEALKWYGTKEVIGEKDNPVIIGWATELKISQYRTDATPWCGLFMAYVAIKAGKNLPTNPLWARDWMKWGNRAATPMLGDVLVFSRGNGGHVGVYVGEDLTHYHVLGGNQGDAVSIVGIDKKRLLGARNSYKSQPANCRVIHLTSSGQLSTNEA